MNSHDLGSRRKRLKEAIEEGQFYNIDQEVVVDSLVDVILGVLADEKRVVVK